MPQFGLQKSMSAAATKVIVVDPSLEEAEMLQGNLKAMPNIKLVGHAKNSSDAVSLLAKSPPHVVLVDSKIAVIDGSELFRAIRENVQTTKIIVLINSEEDLLAVIAYGADGYCPKNDAKRIYEAIAGVVSGEFWIDSATARYLVDAVIGTLTVPHGQSGIDKGADDLSRRELEVLSLVAKGLSNSQIAGKLDISAETVKSHISHIMKKMVVNDRTAAAVKALKRGLI